MSAPSACLYPFPGQFFDRPAGHLHYLDEGQGEPVVMLHGNPTWSFYFRNLIHGLRDQYRCIVPDHIGCGLSAKPSLDQYDFSLKSRIDDVEALLDHLGLTENVTLILHDWGGMIGMSMAARKPERIRRIIAINTAAFRLPATARLPRSLWLGRNTRLGAWLILKHNAFCRAAARWCVTRRPLRPEVREMYLLPHPTPESRISVLKFVQTIPLKPTDPGYDIITHTEESLARFRHLPVLLLWGMKDFVFDSHFLAEWQIHFPNAETHTWPDCGHYLLEDACEEVLPRIQSFLTRNRLAGP